MGSYYRETRHERGGDTSTDTKSDSEQDNEPALPRTHADLDTLARSRGYTWSAEDLTVAQKQAELEE